MMIRQPPHFIMRDFGELKYCNFVQIVYSDETDIPQLVIKILWFFKQRPLDASVLRWKCFVEKKNKILRWKCFAKKVHSSN